MKNHIKTNKTQLLISGLLCLVLFTILLIMVHLKSPYLVINNYIFLLSEKIQNNCVHVLSTGISLFGNKYIIIPTFVITGIILYLKNQKWLSVHLMAPVLIAAFLAYLFKHTIAFPRPEIHNSLESYAFPSRHVTLCSTYITFLAVLFLSKTKTTHFWPVIILSCLIILLESFARIALQIHWMTDVIGGALLGTSCGLLGAYFFFQRPHTEIDFKLMLKTLIINFLIFNLIFLYFA